MYIVDQDRSNVVNIGNVKSVALNGKRITADDYTLAAYDVEQRGKEVFEQMLKYAFPPTLTKFKENSLPMESCRDSMGKLRDASNGVEIHAEDRQHLATLDNGVFYMPEE